jgi:hypothetical protein
MQSQRTKKSTTAKKDGERFGRSSSTKVPYIGVWQRMAMGVSLGPAMPDLHHVRSISPFIPFTDMHHIPHT